MNYQFTPYKNEQSWNDIKDYVCKERLKRKVKNKLESLKVYGINNNETINKEK
jgi:hypothetical protein